jgi:hypothetical protein
MSSGYILIKVWIMGSIFLTVFVAMLFYPLYKRLFHKRVALLRACLAGLFWVATPIWMYEYEMLRSEHNNRRRYET